MYFSTFRNKSISNLCYTALILISVIALIFIMNNTGLAAGTATDDDVLGQRLCKMLSIVQGGTAKAIATIAIFFVAVGLFAGRMTWLTVIPIIIGIIVIFSAPGIVKMIAGGTMDTECDTGS